MVNQSSVPSSGNSVISKSPFNFDNNYFRYFAMSKLTAIVLSLVVLGKTFIYDQYSGKTIRFSFDADVWADCIITRNMVEDTNRIFSYCDERGGLHLLRTETVPAGLKLHMICTLDDVVDTQCLESGSFTVPLPMSCGNPMKATVIKVADRDCSAQMYSVGYMLDDQHLELFRSCYDLGTARVLYSQSDLYYKSFCK